MTPPAESIILIIQTQKRVQNAPSQSVVIGQANFLVQSQKVEGWAIETMLQFETIRDLTPIWNESGTLKHVVSEYPRPPHQWKARDPTSGKPETLPMESQRPPMEL